MRYYIPKNSSVTKCTKTNYKFQAAENSVCEFSPFQYNKWTEIRESFPYAQDLNMHILKKNIKKIINKCDEFQTPVSTYDEYKKILLNTMLKSSHFKFCQYANINHSMMATI